MPSRYVQANTNGRLHPADEPVISPLDRGFLYGDAVYEVWRTYGGVLFTFGEHWARLEASARALHLPLPLDADRALFEISRTATAYRERTGDNGEIYVRLQVSRGGGDIGLDPALAESPVWVLLVQALPQVHEQKLREGLRVMIARNIRRNHPLTLNPLWKSGNYLNNIMALREARVMGADEVLLLNLDGQITEASTMSVAFLSGDEVFTPPLASGLLASITRRFFIHHVAPRAGLVVHEVALRPDDLAPMSEAFFLSTTKDLTPIGRIDRQTFATGEKTRTWQLKRLFAEIAREQCMRHPELRLAPSCSAA